MFRLVLAVLLVVTSGPAFAWTNTTKGSGPQSIADGGPSQAQLATGGAGGAGGTGGTGGHGGHGGSSTVTNTINTGSGSGNGHGGGGGWDGFPPSSPTAPNVYGGNCSGPGGSGAATTPFFGLALGGNQVDRVCQLHMIGQDAAAREYLCTADKDVRTAFLVLGEPCGADLAALPISTKPVFTPSPWCAHATAKQRQANPASCGEATAPSKS